MMQSGDTIKLRATFKDWNGQLADPDSVEVAVYDSRDRPIESATLSADSKESTGVYNYIYTPLSPGIYTVEFKGNLGGYPSVQRIRLDVVFK
jgi:hypothetical protein